MRELNIICFALNIFIAVLVGALLPLLPVLTRKSFLFGVKIPAEQQNCPEAKALKKNYVAICLSGSAILLAIIIAQFLLCPDLTLAALLYFPFLFVGIQLLAYIPNWKKAAKLKEEHGWMVSAAVFADTKSSHSRGNLSELPWGWYILSFALIVISIVVALVFYPGLPDIIPTHFDINMQPDAWSDKSLLYVLVMPILNVVTALSLWLVGVMFVRAKLQIDQQNPELSFLQHRIYRRRFGHGMGLLTLVSTAMIACVGIMTVFPEIGSYVPFWVTVSLPIVACVPLVAVIVTSGQGGCRIKSKEGADEAGPIKEASGANAAPGRGDDKFWALGMFYHNPDDPSYIVEDRFGSNLGFNYSRLPVKIGTAVVAVGVVALYVWMSFVLLPMIQSL